MLLISSYDIMKSCSRFQILLLSVLGWSTADVGMDEAWGTVTTEAVKECFAEDDLKRKQSSWPLITFFAVVFGGPWLIWKIINSLSQKTGP